MRGLGKIGRVIQSDLRRITGGNLLNSAEIIVVWSEPIRSFDFEQILPTAAWEVTHGLGRLPLMAVISSGGELIAAQLQAISDQSSEVLFSEPQSGAALFVRPHFVHAQTVASTLWTIYHNLGSNPIVQLVVGSEAVVAGIQWVNSTTVKVAFTEPTAGHAVMGTPTYDFSQSEPSSDWVVHHHLGRNPIVQFIGEDGLAIFGRVTYPDANTFRLELSAPASGTAVAIHVGDAELEVDPNLESSQPSMVRVSGTWPALVHFVSPLKSGFRQFAEVEAGDVFLDFVQDVPLSGKSGVVFVVDGREYVQKTIGRKLAEYYDLVIGGKRMVRTVLAQLKG